nr:immunoglobulin heavy chain junction region [Macaca mulatta]
CARSEVRPESPLLGVW